MRLLARDLGAVSGKLKIEADTAKASVFELTTLLEKSPRETLMIMKHKILNEELEGAKATILELQDNLAQLKMDAAAARRAQSVKLSDIHDTNDELLPTVLAVRGYERHENVRGLCFCGVQWCGHNRPSCQSSPTFAQFTKKHVHVRERISTHTHLERSNSQDFIGLVLQTVQGCSKIVELQMKLCLFHFCDGRR